MVPAPGHEPGESSLSEEGFPSVPQAKPDHEVNLRKEFEGLPLSLQIPLQRAACNPGTSPTLLGLDPFPISAPGPEEALWICTSSSPLTPPVPPLTGWNETQTDSPQSKAAGEGRDSHRERGRERW